MPFEPRHATAGDIVTWNRIQANYPPSDGWVLTYYFGLGTTVKTVTTAAGVDGQSYDVSIDLSTWTPGLWRWSARVNNADSSIKHVVETGVLTLAPDPSTAFDRRSHAEKCLAAIEAVIEGRMTDPIIQYEIDGVKAIKLPHGELMKLRGYYKAVVNRQAGKSLFTAVPVRFP